MSKKNRLICHILEQDTLKEVGIAKGNTIDAEIKWNKRAWAIAEESKKTCFITDRKGVTHCFVNPNQADGIFHLLSPTQLNLYDQNKEVIDKCGKCGGNISIDAQAQRIFVNKQIYKGFWGTDNSYMLLLIIFAIVAVIAIGAVFFLVGENNRTNQILQKYLQEPPNIVTSPTSYNLMEYNYYVI